MRKKKREKMCAKGRVKIIWTSYKKKSWKERKKERERTSVLREKNQSYSYQQQRQPQQKHS